MVVLTMYDAVACF